MGNKKSHHTETVTHVTHHHYYHPPPAKRPALVPALPPPPRPPSPTFREPWRKVSWGNNQEDLDYVKNYNPKVDGIKHLRVLIYGPVGFGKSSFISSVSSTLVGRMTIPAEANATTSDQSHTRKYKTYKIHKGDRGNFYPFVFNDVMGLEEKTGSGVRPEDIKLAMMGHVKEDYKFKSDSPLSSGDPYYNPSPSPDDKVHVLVCVHSANSGDINASTVQKMKEIREAASDLGIPQLAVGTKVDEACGETEKDLKNVYKSKYIKKKIQEFSSTVGVPLNCIFPVKNYSKEASTDDDVDTLILSVLRMIIDVGDDFIYKTFYQKPLTPPPSPPTFRVPWRNISWGNNQEDFDHVAEYQPKVNGIKHVRVLLYGPVGVGKSSFINSVSNTLRRRMTQSAGVSGGSSEKSFTKQYRTHKIKKEGGGFYSVVFNDIMGLEEESGRGVRVDDIKLALMGHVKNGYKFKSDSPLSSGDQYYNPSPSPDDKVHVLVCVQSANATEIEPSTLQKMKEIRELANDLGIPQLAVVTKVDEACDETDKDLQNVYKSKYIEKKMKDFSSALGVPTNSIFPVKNYSKEDSTVDDVDTLILRVLRQIIDLGNDFIDQMFDES